MMKKITLFFCLLLCNLLFAQLLTGVGFQKGINEYWKTDVRINSMQDISVSYPSLGCSGKWLLLQEDQRGSLLKEVILYGADKCTPEGYVYLTKDPLSPTSYRFYVFENKGDEIPYALGILEKI